jgi:tetratricopeptide (TPR) repeat protein
LRRIAFITESSTRQSEPMEAYKFYQGHRSRWVNAVISYMIVRDFPREDIYFLSQHEQRIVGFNEIVAPYPVQKFHPRKDASRQFAEKILAQVLSYNPLPFVEIHSGRTVADPLMELFNQHGIEYRLYGDGVPLGAKPSAYDALIEEEQNIRKLKEIQREKWHVTACIQHRTPQEASRFLTEYADRAELYGVEGLIRELKELLGSYNQKRKDEKKALQELETVLKQEDKEGELAGFLSAKKSLPDLLANLTDYERLKSKFGKAIAKFTLYLLKRDFALQTENRISEAMLRMQIALLK